MIAAIYNSSDNDGGAAKAAFRLMSALRASGVHAFFLCRHKQSKSVHSIRLVDRHSEMSSRLRRLERFWSSTAIRALVTDNRTELSSTIFSVDPLGMDVTEAPIASIARVHHLHWCRGFISPAAIRHLRATGRPIFVTLHDQWWMTGGCHYSAGCDNYERVCADCPQLLCDTAEIAPVAQKEKIAAFEADTTVIAPSQWMADCAKRSSVFRNADIRVIRNAVDIDTFAPIAGADRIAMRSQLGVQDGEVAILFGAQTLGDGRKGFVELVDALKQVKERTSRRLRLISFGRAGKFALEAIGIPTIALGEIVNDAQLAKVYAAADLFVVPSKEDNYPNTIVEALACGTPVIGFAAGGIADLVDNSATGRLADVGDVSQLAEAILDGIEKYVDSPSIRKACRDAVSVTHSPANIASQVTSLYAEKAPEFYAPLESDELAIIEETKERNYSGKGTYARMDMSMTLFNSESVIRALLPLSGIHEHFEDRLETERKLADLSVQRGAFCGIGRLQAGRRHLGAGWSEPQKDGAWSADRCVYLHFFVTPGFTINRMNLRLSGMNKSSQIVSIRQELELKSALIVEGNTRQEHRVMLSPVTGPAYVNIRLDLSSTNACEPPSENPKILISGFSVHLDTPPPPPPPLKTRLINKCRLLAKRVHFKITRTILGQ